MGGETLQAQHILLYPTPPAQQMLLILCHGRASHPRLALEYEVVKLSDQTALGLATFGDYFSINSFSSGLGGGRVS